MSFIKWSIPSELGTKVKQVMQNSLSQYVRTYGMAKDMNSQAFRQVYDVATLTTRAFHALKQWQWHQGIAGG